MTNQVWHEDPRRLTFILARGIGQAFVAPDVDAAEVRAFLVEKFAGR